MITCFVCKETKRTDRMSTHILSKHRDNIINCKFNEEILEATIKDKNCTTNICLTSPDKMEHRFHCSFGFPSGWKKGILPESGRKNATEHKEKHLEVCKSLLDEIKNPTINNKDYNDLKKKYDKLQEEYNENEDDSMKMMIQKDTILEVVARKYSINLRDLKELDDEIHDILQLSDEEKEEQLLKISLPLPV